MDMRIDKKIVIDAYRGGDDVGNNVNGILEKDYNLEISKYIYDRLKSLGIPVSITRDSDETIDMSNRINRIKSFYGNGNDVVVISNALTTGGTGAEVIYALRNSNGLSNKLASELEKSGIDSVKSYQRRLPSNTALDYNQLIRDTANNESVIVYYGNADNVNEALFLKNNLEEIGEAIVIAITDYLNIEYKPMTGSNYYIVKKGDSLYSIANKYNTSVNELKSLNNLSNNNLSIGQVLKIPTKIENEDLSNEDVIIYTVKSGDTLYRIANLYNTTIDGIKRLNNLTNNNLSIGQKLRILDNNKDMQTNYITYKVVSGDSLYSIARRYNTTVDQIKILNNLSSNLLSINQVLKIPTNNSNSINTYKVVSGDSLYSIAKKFNTTVNVLKSLNNLNSNLLSIGQVLKIPNS